MAQLHLAPLLAAGTLIFGLAVGTALSQESTREPITFDDDPVLEDDYTDVTAGTPIAIDVLENDKNADPAELRIKQKPACGRARQGNDTILYTPDRGCTGQQVFTYAIGPENDAPTARVYINIIPPDQPSTPPEYACSALGDDLKMTAIPGRRLTAADLPRSIDRIAATVKDVKDGQLSPLVFDDFCIMRWEFTKQMYKALLAQPEPESTAKPYLPPPPTPDGETLLMGATFDVALGIAQTLSQQVGPAWKIELPRVTDYIAAAATFPPGKDRQAFFNSVYAGAMEWTIDSCKNNTVILLGPKQDRDRSFDSICLQSDRRNGQHGFRLVARRLN